MSCTPASNTESSEQLNATIRPASLSSAVARRLDAWRTNAVLERLWKRDHTIWFAEPRPELSDRLGWLDLPTTMRDGVGALRLTPTHPVDTIVVLGMGGSSLAPEVFGTVLPTAPGSPEIIVLDSTHPQAVANAQRNLDLPRSHFLVASKSGTTVETLSLFRFFWDIAGRATSNPGDHFSAITDAGTPLQALAEDRRFHAVVTSPQDVGGRFSALTPFGLVPAAMAGANVEALLDGAAVLAAPERADTAVELGALLGEAATAGRDKLTLITSPSLASFPAWLEQLVAESTGKHGTGIVPVVGDHAGNADGYGDDRVFLMYRMAGEDLPVDPDALTAAGHPVASYELATAEDLGREMYRAEIAVSLAGSILGINPFDQPDVQLAKELAKEAMAGELEAAIDEVPAVAAPDRLRMLLAAVPPRGYVGVLAFLPPTPDNDAALADLRASIGRRLPGTAVTIGYGPRFLHSTGQLHKGGPATGTFLQLVDTPGPALPVPETDYSFGDLIAGQSAGDFEALRGRKRRALRINVGENAAATIAELAAGLTD